MIIPVLDHFSLYDEVVSLALDTYAQCCLALVPGR